MFLLFKLKWRESFKGSEEVEVLFMENKPLGRAVINSD